MTILPWMLWSPNNMASVAPRIHAILVGIDRYEKLPYNFQRALDGTKDMRGILIMFGVEEENIETFGNAESTTQQAIMDKVKDKANRGDPIIFYYSGYIGSMDVQVKWPALTMTPDSDGSLVFPWTRWDYPNLS